MARRAFPNNLEKYTHDKKLMKLKVIKCKNDIKISYLLTDLNNLSYLVGLQCFILLLKPSKY